MNAHAAVHSNWASLVRPNGDPIRLNHQDFVAIDRDSDATYDPIYRPQALYNRVLNGFHANNEAFLLQEVATNLPIYRPDAGPTDFHLHLPPGGFQLVLVTSGLFTFDYDGLLHHVGPGALILQSAIVHRQSCYSWSGLPTDANLKTPQTVVPDPLSMGYSGKFIEAFITEPTTFPNPTVVHADEIDEAETPHLAWSHPFHDRPQAAGFWFQASRRRAAIWSPATSSPRIRRASRCCRRAAPAPPTSPDSARARSWCTASFAARPNSRTGRASGSNSRREIRSPPACVRRRSSGWGRIPSFSGSAC